MAEPTTEPSAVDVVRALWARMEARDWPSVRALLGDGLVVELPATGERFRSADAYVTFNARYPDGWTLQVQRVVAAGPSTDLDGEAADLVVSEVQVPQADVGVFAVVQLAWVRGGRVVSAREFWITCGGEEAPAWRANLVERYDGRLAAGGA